MPILINQASAPDARVIVLPKSKQGMKASAAEYGLLKAREKELNNQLSSVQDRRDEMARDLLQKTGDDRTALQSRIGGLDQRLSQIESDLAVVGRELAATAPVSIAEPPPRIVYNGFDDGDLTVAGLIGAALMFSVFIPFLIRSFRRRRHVSPSAPQSAIGGERIERMEHAIDTIAVEIERVSENQRFMTRLMTETQLAGTIAAVRGSADAAKAAAEGLPSAH